MPLESPTIKRTPNRDSDTTGALSPAYEASPNVAEGLNTERAKSKIPEGGKFAPCMPL